MLVHETTDASGAPRGLELAYSTPRDWLRPGQPIEVRKLPTSFGRVSFALESLGDSVRISLDVPDRAPPTTLRLRLRLPDGDRVTEVLRDGVPYGRVLPDGQTVVLPPTPGRFELEAPLG